MHVRPERARDTGPGRARGARVWANACVCVWRVYVRRCVRACVRGRMRVYVCVPTRTRSSFVPVKGISYRKIDRAVSDTRETPSQGHFPQTNRAVSTDKKGLPQRGISTNRAFFHSMVYFHKTCHSISHRCTQSRVAPTQQHFQTIDAILGKVLSSP